MYGSQIQTILRDTKRNFISILHPVLAENDGGKKVRETRERSDL